jgi:ubiquinone/menaquinone biosynthesis C-methylase UbiE
MVGEGGKVFAVDLQQDMLDKLLKKASGLRLPQLKLLKCEKECVGVSEPVDFAVAFYVIHEIPNQARFFREISHMLKSSGRLLLVEPRFHVSKEAFEKTVGVAKTQGLTPDAPVSVFMSRAILFKGNGSHEDKR